MHQEAIYTHKDSSFRALLLFLFPSSYIVNSKKLSYFSSYSLFLIVFALFFCLFSAQEIEASRAIAAYVSNETGTNTQPRVRFWEPTATGSWGSEVSLPAVNTPLRNVMVEYSPVSSKIAMITLEDGGNLTAYVCMTRCDDASNWDVTTELTSVWTTAPTIDSRRFDLEFENETGDLVVAASVVNTSVGCELISFLLPNTTTSFSGIDGVCIDDLSSALDVQYLWVSLASNATQEIAMASFDFNANDINAWIWDGNINNWSNFQELTSDSSGASAREAFALAYASDNSNLTAITTDGSGGNVVTYQWTGTAWYNHSVFDTDSGDTGVAQRMPLKADPASDDLMISLYESTGDLSSAYFDGTTWTVVSNLDESIDAISLANSRPGDFFWNNTGSTAMIATDTDGAGTTLNVTTCTPQCNASPFQEISSYAGSGAWIETYNNPTPTDNISAIGIRLNANADIGAFSWDGNNFSNYGDTQLADNTNGELLYQGFDLSFERVGDAAPSVTLVDPLNNNVTEGAALNFTFNATEDIALENATFYHNISGTWTAIETALLNGTFNETTFAVTGLTTTAFIWNVEVCDTNYNCTFGGTNFTVTVSLSTAPTFSSITQTPTSGTAFSATQFYEFNITWTDDIQVDNVFIVFDSTNYSAAAGAVYNLSDVYSFNRTGLSAGTYTYAWYANDTNGNENQTNDQNYVVASASSSSTTQEASKSSKSSLNRGNTANQKSSEPGDGQQEKPRGKGLFDKSSFTAPLQKATDYVKKTSISILEMLKQQRYTQHIFLFVMGVVGLIVFVDLIKYIKTSRKNK